MKARAARAVVVAALLLHPGWSPAAELKLTLPAGLQEDAAQIPDDNPITRDKVGARQEILLGQALVGVGKGGLRQLPSARSRLE